MGDHLGTVRDLIDSSGNVVNHLRYEAFGRITSETNAAVDFLFAFTGRERDEESGLFYYRARYYDPAVGRFISEDPLGFAAGDGNLSRYVENLPTGLSDPTGLVPPMGHHVVVVEVLNRLAQKQLITRDAYDVGLGMVLGPTDPPHRNGTYGGITHPQYNEFVNDIVKKYIDRP
ncbi:MAG: hypothetical protein KatS3mg110_2151 [Pirellulaceae bacterium]|nr:MAG: hypothetical protein KatS3mg110_2151 [Pirellulaceae bacterium]